jgi:hypothetical protein
MRPLHPGISFGIDPGQAGRRGAGSSFPRRPGLVLLALLLAIAPAGAGKEKDKDQPAGAEKPKILLKPDPAVGFTPLTVVVSGLVSGLRRTDPNFCHAAVTWSLVWPGQREEDAQKVREDPSCLHGEDEISVDLAYSKVFNLVRPGSYLVRLEIEGKDGTRIRSAIARIQVLRVQ